jgi:hypothetical protein
MYEKGQLKISIPSPDEYCMSCHNVVELHPTHSYPSGRIICEEFKQDSTLTHSINSLYGEKGDTPLAYLPHSCDEWVIGGKEEIQALIDDLTEVIKNY